MSRETFAEVILNVSSFRFKMTLTS